MQLRIEPSGHALDTSNPHRPSFVGTETPYGPKI